ncbi:granule-bound starch synthase 1, chloroplastic/amyloplastic-like [Camellia sinensis]|uniref:granule-bound starch synthase 1, chloroplastic/amyloplastic-like n=1 Tax=Camellia sinensis TaxID=4442 RepID=UPI001036343A|nr:granule-bound starch synthase 1, chloroplastic/amyloplastic-like [Camellia sinensis]
MMMERCSSESNDDNCESRVMNTLPKAVDGVIAKLENLKMESYEVNSRGVEIFTKSWLPKTCSPKAIIYYCHGYGDTCTFLAEGIARKLVFSGYGVFAMDYPGFGLSEGLHGYIPSFDILVDDVIEQYSKTKGIVPNDLLFFATILGFLCGNSIAALEAPRILNLNNNKYFSGPYGEDVVFIANDWHTALLPCYLKTKYKPMGIYKNARVVFCIHNIAYQGRFPFADFSLLNLPEQFKGSFDFIDGYDKPAKGRKINWMKGGILESDRVVTVSPYYAQELVSGIDKGVELDNIIRKTGITGIVNGMDVQEWNPSTDKYIDVKYNATTVMAAKRLLKEALQAEVGLPVDANIPLIGFIGRLEEQKGSDILAAAIPKFIRENVQIVVLGTGKKYMEKQLEQLEIIYPDKARRVAKFNVPLAHMIIAGSDFMLLPSRFEPCGLIQLHAMQYGSVNPVFPPVWLLLLKLNESCTITCLNCCNNCW